MIKVVSIGFKEVGKIYWFDPKNFQLKKGDKVIVETVRGIEIGEVIENIKEVNEKSLDHELKAIMRVASLKDIQRQEENEAQALKDNVICKKLISEHKLEMKLLGCEYTLDKQKMIIYYNAEGRIDFRELLKDLASTFRVRIELRQIGPRDEIKVYPNLGMCGREVCCRTHLQDFKSVTIKDAKDQGLQINMSKLSGACGRLMCCIKYEEEGYKENLKKLPKYGETVKVKETKETGKVANVDILNLKVRVKFGDSRENEKYEMYDANELTWNTNKN